EQRADGDRQTGQVPLDDVGPALGRRGEAHAAKARIAPGVHQHEADEPHREEDVNDGEDRDHGGPGYQRASSALRLRGSRGSARRPRGSPRAPRRRGADRLRSGREWWLALGRLPRGAGVRWRMRYLVESDRERIQKLLVTGDNRLKQGVAPAKARASYEQAL